MNHKLSKAFLITSLLIPTYSWASFGGVYVGVHGGGVLLKGTHTYSNSSNQGVQKLNSFSYLGGAHAGYLSEMGGTKAVVGIEAYYTMTGLKPKKDLQVDGGVLEGKVVVRHKSSMGAAVLTGVAVNPKVVMYIRAGFEKASFQMQYSQLTFQTPNSQAYNKSTTAIVPGAGILYKMSERITIAGEYQHPLYNKIAPRTDTVAPLIGYIVNPVEHRITLKVSMTF
jgi:hypothetical protein